MREHFAMGINWIAPSVNYRLKMWKFYNRVPLRFCCFVSRRCTSFTVRYVRLKLSYRSWLNPLIWYVSCLFGISCCVGILNTYACFKLTSELCCGNYFTEQGTVTLFYCLSTASKLNELRGFLKRYITGLINWNTNYFFRLISTSEGFWDKQLR